ncbi:MAG: hypothetical protein ACOX0A_02455 [Thermoguttaceae bacterium]
MRTFILTNKNFASRFVLALFAVFLTLAFVPGQSRVMAQNNSQTAKQDNSPGDLSTIVKFSKGLFDLMGSPREDVSPSDDAPFATELTPVKDFPIPGDAGVVVTISSLRNVDRAVKEFFTQTSDLSFSVLESLKFTAYRGALRSVNTVSPVGVVLFCDSIPPRITVVLPVADKQFANFVTSVAEASKSAKPEIDEAAKKAWFTMKLNAPLHLVAQQVSENYVAITNIESEAVLARFNADKILAETSFLSPELKSPVISVNVTQRGLTDFCQPNRPFWNEIKDVLNAMKRSARVLDDVRLDNIHSYAAENLSRIRCDLTLDDYGLYAALQMAVNPGSNAAKQLTTYRNAYPLNVTADRFFSVLSDVESTLAGQADLPVALTQTLPKPLDRINFVEYCLGLPAEGELAAGSFMFYLEVDDAEAFAREMIVPRAREVGRYIGAKQGGEMASQLFGNLAERRLVRQNNRRRPVPNARRANPERAAEVGNSLGSALGALIGENAGEEVAMKEHRLFGYKMYVSDIETYTRQTALMRAEQEGRYVSRNASFGSFSLVEALISIIQNDGMFQRRVLYAANAEASKVDRSMLFAKEGYLVILDKNTILYSLGNLDLLKLGVNNYRATKEPNINYLAQTLDQDTPKAIAHLGALIPDLKNTNVIGSTRVDVAASQAYYRWLQHYYFNGAPSLSNETLPFDTPKLLVVSSVTPRCSIQRCVAPHEAVANIIKTFSGGKTLPELIFTPNVGLSTDTEDELDVDFDDE